MHVVMPILTLKGPKRLPTEAEEKNTNKKRIETTRKERRKDPIRHDKETDR